MGLFGLCTVEPAELPDPIPVVPAVPVVPPVVVPGPLLFIAPPVVELPAELPAAPPACASAKVLDSANAVARAMVVSFMTISLWVIVSEQRVPKVLCSVGHERETSRYGDPLLRSLRDPDADRVDRVCRIRRAERPKRVTRRRRTAH